MSELTYKMLTLPAVLLMEAQIPKEMVSSLNKYLDNLLKNKDRVTAADTLVGQIHGGEQLTMDHECKELEEVRIDLCSIAARYVTDFLGMTGQTLVGARQIDIDKPFVIVDDRKYIEPWCFCMEFCLRLDEPYCNEDSTKTN